MERIRRVVRGYLRSMTLARRAKQTDPARGARRAVKGRAKEAGRAGKAGPTSAEVSNEDTQHRLLMTAGEVFARRGFRDSTVREISTLAGANLAAVNYHFGDKKGLYHAVIACGQEAAGPMPADEAAGISDPREALRVYCRAFLRRILDHRKPEWHSKLMAREMAEPTEALDEMVKMMIRPHWERLGAIVGAILGPAASPRLVRLATQSITSQMVFYAHARPVLDRLFPAEEWSPASIERRGEDVAAFSLAALDSLRRVGGKA